VCAFSGFGVNESRIAFIAFASPFGDPVEWAFEVGFAPMKRALSQSSLAFAVRFLLAAPIGMPLALATASIATIVTVSSDAHAAGSAHLQSSKLSETGGAWHVFVTVELPKPPPIAHVPMKFIFTRTMAFELSRVDGHADPQETQQSLQGQSPTIESLDVDFADGSGKIFKGTRFDFGVTRTRGYLPGEYKLQIRTADGTDIGSPLTVTLNRTTNKDDPNYKVDIVDRRSMTFNAKDSSIKKYDNGLDAGATKVGPGGDDSPSGANPGNGDVAPAGSAPPFIPASAYTKTPEEMNDHPKGCGCSVPGGAPFSLAFLALPFGAAILGVRSRRRNRKA
jgi:MYXO-CTERM domain-containing protein